MKILWHSEESSDSSSTSSGSDELSSSMTVDKEKVSQDDAPPEDAVRLVWSSLRLYHKAKDDPGGTEDQPTLLRDVSGHASVKSIVLLSGPTRAPPLALLRILAGEINPDSGQLLRGGTEGLQNMTVLLRTFGDRDNSELLFQHLSLKDSIGSYIIRAQSSEDVSFTQIQETIGRTLLPSLPFQDVKVRDLPEHERNFLTLNLALSCARKIVLLDDPLLGLTYGQVRLIIDKLKNLREEGCAIVLYSSIHAELLFTVVDRFYLFKRGGSPLIQGRMSNPAVVSLKETKSGRIQRTVPDKARSPRAKDRVRTLASLSRLDRLKGDGSAIFSEIVMSALVNDPSLVTAPILSNVVFTCLCATLASKRDRLSDEQQPLFDLNLYFYLQVFVAAQAFLLEFRSSQPALRVIAREWRNASYRLGDALWGLSSMNTIITCLCTCAVSTFVFLVTGQRNLPGEGVFNQTTTTAWAPFLFVLTALLTALNFARLGFFLAVVSDQGKLPAGRLRIALYLLLLVVVATAVIPCRLFPIQAAIDTGRHPMRQLWMAMTLMSPLSAGQALMFFAVYGTQPNVLCLPTGNRTLAECIPYSWLAGVDNPTTRSLVLVPVWYYVFSPVLWMGAAIGLVGYLIFAYRLNYPFITAVGDSRFLNEVGPGQM